MFGVCVCVCVYDGTIPLPSTTLTLIVGVTCHLTRMLTLVMVNSSLHNLTNQQLPPILECATMAARE
jgi:hypothetical protein